MSAITHAGVGGFNLITLHGVDEFDNVWSATEMFESLDFFLDFLNAVLFKQFHGEFAIVGIKALKDDSMSSFPFIYM